MSEINLYEFIGVMMGDGYLLDYPKHGIYGIEITGNYIEETDYYDRLGDFMEKEFNIKRRIFVRKDKSGNSIKLKVYNKELVKSLKGYGIKRNKTYNTYIKDELTDWEKSKHIIRGIFETDGSLYFSK